MKKFLIFLPIIAIITGCKISINFDWAMLERFTNKISYLYANCRSDIEWLQETMTPESIESMDQTCAASIKAITKIRKKIEKLKWRIWENETLNDLLDKVDEIINSLQNTKDQISDISTNYGQWDLSTLLDQLNWQNLINNLENLTKDFGK